MSNPENTEEIKKCFELAKTLQETMKLSYLNDGSNIFRFASYKMFMRKFNHVFLRVVQTVPNVDGLIGVYDIDKVPGPADTIPIQQKELFESVLLNTNLLVSFLSQKLGLKENEILNLRNFLQSNLRKAILKEPHEEVDVQDAIEQLLIGRGLSKGIDYDREKGRIKVSIKEVIPDFIIFKLDLALEVKFTKKYAKTKAIVDEINADIQSYSKKFNNIYFIVYDFGTIRDEDEFKNDIDNKENILVSIVKH
ncbi:MAG TPA: hypothetical protein VGA67_04865 [Candidatus Dojkabacteria bacterium]|jgi:hypothetical protein